MKVNYVEYNFPGLLCSENTTPVKVDTFNVEAARSNMPKGAYGFTFFSREEQDSAGEILVGFKKYTGFYFIGRKLTLDAVKKEMPDKTILIKNMECNGYKAVVRVKCGQCFPVGENDVVLGGEER